jgi:hypothetical protein
MYPGTISGQRKNISVTIRSPELQCPAAAGRKKSLSYPNPFPDGQGQDCLFKLLSALKA